MKNLEKKNTFAKVLLIISLVYVLIGIVATAFGFHRMFDGYNLFEYIEFLGDLYPRSPAYARLSVVLLILRIIDEYLIYGIWVMWILVVATDKKSIRIPAVITMAYYILGLVVDIFAVVLYRESLYDAVRRSGFTFILFVIWLILVINTGKTFRMVFAILRWILAGIYILSYIRQEMMYSRSLINGDTYFVPNMIFMLVYIIGTLVIAAFVLWILKPELFDKKEVKGQ